MIAVTVHTTGVNIDGVLANVASIAVILGVFATFIVRTIKRSISDTVSTVINEKVTPILEEIQRQLRDHDTRLAHLEGVQKGKRYAVDAASVTTTGTAV